MGVKNKSSADERMEKEAPRRASDWSCSQSARSAAEREGRKTRGSEQKGREKSGLCRMTPASLSMQAARWKVEEVSIQAERWKAEEVSIQAERWKVEDRVDLM